MSKIGRERSERSLIGSAFWARPMGSSRSTAERATITTIEQKTISRIEEIRRVKQKIEIGKLIRGLTEIGIRI